MKIKHLGLCTLLVVSGLALSGQVFAKKDDSDCSDDTQAAIEAEFGVGAAAATRCLDNTRKVRVVYQVNVACKDANCTAPYAIGNIKNAVKDYENTHGMSPDDYEIVAVVHSGGTPLILAGGQFQADVEAIMAMGVKVYYCQNTARKKGVKFADMIPGVEFVTSGVTAIADFQLEGYGYVQP